MSQEKPSGMNGDRSVTTPMLTSNTKTAESDILRMLDQLEALLDGSTHLMNHALWVDLDAFFSTTANIRSHLPDDIRRATKVARDSEKIVEQARTEAERIRNEAAEDAERILQDARRNGERLNRDAQEQANRLVADHEVLRQAQQEGRTLLAEAEEEARQIRDGADRYAFDILSQMDESLSKAVSHVRRGLEKLERDSAPE
ncbi:MAG TPA: hypothetical protein VFJ58_26175 [Armatimonadota bacterium]|nr:hypothetical protein [Armatimonadota bacterium]